MPTREYIPIRPRAGGLVHATSMNALGRTNCNKKCDGWVIAPERLTCTACQDAVHLPGRRGSTKGKREARP